MHTELGTRGERRDSGGWDLERLAVRFGISAQVQFDRGLSIGEGVPASELALRMGACDIHLLPFEGGGWELTVLETAACGVVNVITDAGAPPEYAAPFSELVPVACRVFGATGMRSLIDVGQAVGALLQVAHQPGRRRRMSQSGQEEAVAYSWTVIGQAWHRLLATLAAGGSQ
jgi:glycosyltransferase involved in cell wall biosynthesis